MSEIFMEETISGKKYPRCLRIEIQNTKDGLPSIQFVTEDVLEIEGNKIYSGCKVNQLVFNADKERHLRIMNDLIAEWQELQTPVVAE